MDTCKYSTLLQTIIMQRFKILLDVLESHGLNSESTDGYSNSDPCGIQTYSGQGHCTFKFYFFNCCNKWLLLMSDF